MWGLETRFPGAATLIAGSPTRRRLVEGAFWGTLGGISARVLSLVASFLIARRLGHVGFGEYGVIAATLALGNSLATVGVGITATRYVAEFRGRSPVRAGRVIALSTVLTWTTGLLAALVFVALAPWMAARVLAAPHLAGMLRLSAVSVALGVVAAAQGAALAGLEAFRPAARVGVATGVLQAALSIMGCWAYGLPGVLVAWALSLGFTCYLNHQVLRTEMRRFGINPDWGTMFREWRVFVDFGLPAFLGSVMVTPAFWYCSTLLANRPNGYAALGTFNAANQWYWAIQFLPSLLGTAVLPVMAERSAAGDGSSSTRIMKGMMLATTIMVIPAVIATSLMSGFIMAGYGPAFADGSRTLVLTVVTAGLLAVLSPAAQVIAAAGRMWIGLWMNCGWAAVLIVSSRLLIGHGAEGLAGGRLLAYVAHSVWTIAFVAHLARRSRGAVATVPDPTDGRCTNGRGR